MTSDGATAATSHHRDHASKFRRDGAGSCPGSGFFESLSDPQQFALLSLGMFLFFGAHNVLQEAIMKVPGFSYGVMLGYLEVLGVTVCSFLERTYVAKEKGRVAPLSSYPLLTLCLLVSSGMSNMSLNYINFPTKVVFRSCKLLPTMVMATIINKKVFQFSEYLSAIAVCAGLVMFTAADWKLTPSFNPLGLILVSLSVCADAVLPNVQEKLFRQGSSRLEVTFYTNVFTLGAMTVTTLASGDLVGMVQHAMRDSRLALYCSVYTMIAYVAISTYMNIVKRFGGVAAVLLATARKGMTLVLSFLLFPKAFSLYYVAGATLVLGGLLAASLIKQKMRAMEKDGEKEPLTQTRQDGELDLEAGSKNFSGGDQGQSSAAIMQGIRTAEPVPQPSI